MMDDWLKSDYSNVYLVQAGGKYATFACPECGLPKQKFKMTANHGECDSCGTTYQMLATREANHIKGMAFPNYYADLEITSD